MPEFLLDLLDVCPELEDSAIPLQTLKKRLFKAFFFFISLGLGAGGVR